MKKMYPMKYNLIFIKILFSIVKLFIKIILHFEDKKSEYTNNTKNKTPKII